MSLRVLLLAVTAFVVWLGLTVARSQRQEAAVEALKSSIVVWDYQVPDGDWGKWNPVINADQSHLLAGPTGHGLFSRVVGLGVELSATPAELERLANLTDLTFLDLTGSLHLNDEMMPIVGRLSKLKVLDLQLTHVTDAGVAQLDGLSNLESLGLNFTPVTDACLEHLAKLPRLKTLQLNDTRVTDEGVRRFREQRPDCEVTWGLTWSPQGEGEGAAQPAR